MHNELINNVLIINFLMVDTNFQVLSSHYYLNIMHFHITPYSLNIKHFYHYFIAIVSISTSAPSGSLTTPYAARAGGFSG